jgi:hypothetical protein
MVRKSTVAPSRSTKRVQWNSAKAVAAADTVAVVVVVAVETVAIVAAEIVVIAEIAVAAGTNAGNYILQKSGSSN